MQLAGTSSSTVSLSLSLSLYLFCSSAESLSLSSSKDSVLVLAFFSTSVTFAKKDSRFRGGVSSIIMRDCEDNHL